MAQQQRARAFADEQAITLAQLLGPAHPRTQGRARPRERGLAHELDQCVAGSAAQLAAGDYAGVLGRLATLRTAVDAFFDQVLVNCDDARLRANRYALLARLRAAFLGVADISLLVVSA